MASKINLIEQLQDKVGKLENLLKAKPEVRD
jgi:hypothetical protein